MVPGTTTRRVAHGRLRAAEYARQRREELGLTQSDVALAAGVRDVKTIRNLETGRNWPNDLTRRGIETALRVEIGTLDRIGDGGETGEVEQQAEIARVGGLGAIPSAQELIDLSSAITKLSAVHEAMLRRGDDSNAETVRSLIDAVSAVMAGFGPALERTVARVQRDAGLGVSST
jgi:transcriptional regulator with XRE-family HTH domain